MLHHSLRPARKPPERPGVLALFDRDTAGAKRWRLSRRAEQRYGKALRSVAANIRAIVDGMVPDTLEAIPPGVADALQSMLYAYARTLEPWAKAVGQSMLDDVATRDFADWMAYSRQMGRAVRQEIESAPTGQLMRNALAQQVDLITSLPTEAAQRVQTLATESIIKGQRPADLIEAIRATGDVTEARAQLIARTEIGRATAEFRKARAQQLGSTHFIWRTADDSDVRPSHKKLNGKTFAWDDPPVCDPPNHRALPGAIWNCRCFSEPILPDD